MLRRTVQLIALAMMLAGAWLLLLGTVLPGGQLLLIGLVSDMISGSRKLLEDVLYRVRSIEIKMSEDVAEPRSKSVAQFVERE